MAVLKYTEWQSGTGQWTCGDVSDLANLSNAWWHPARALGITPAAYVKMVIEKFKPDRISYSPDCSVVGFYWDKIEQERKYKNYINKIAREKHYLV